MAITQLNEDELKANQTEYLAWRSTKIGSSDVPIILGNSPFKTPYGLWLEKTGRASNNFKTTINIELGKKYEDTVRSSLELKLGVDFAPVIMQSDLHPFMMASLDGYNEENKIVLEIKSVLGLPTWESAVAGKVSDSYIDQVQHQLWVSNATKCFFYVAKVEPFMGDYRIADKRLIESYPDKTKQTELVSACLEFYQHMVNDIPPQLTEKDSFLIEDTDVLELLKDSANKTKIIDACLEIKEHRSFNLGHKASLYTNKFGTWILKFK